MIDVRKCEFEESYSDDDCTVYYFTYPKDLSEVPFDDEGSYGNVFCMCVSLTVLKTGESYMSMSPTIADEDAWEDVDWRDLAYGVNYTDDTVASLIEKAPS